MASRYNDWAIVAPLMKKYTNKLKLGKNLSIYLKIEENQEDLYPYGRSDLWPDVWIQVFFLYLCLQADADMATSFNLIFHPSHGTPPISINQNQPYFFQDQ
jgi:hypothetical protein